MSKNKRDQLTPNSTIRKKARLFLQEYNACADDEKDATYWVLCRKYGLGISFLHNNIVKAQNYGNGYWQGELFDINFPLNDLV